jgi:hypothetical protein
MIKLHEKYKDGRRKQHKANAILIQERNRKKKKKDIRA